MYQPKVPQVIGMRYFVENTRACGATLCDPMVKGVHLLKDPQSPKLLTLNPIISITLKN